MKLLIKTGIVAQLDNYSVCDVGIYFTLFLLLLLTLGFLDLTVKVVHLQNVSSDYKIAVTSAGGLVQFPAANLVADRNGSGTYSYIVT